MNIFFRTFLGLIFLFTLCGCFRNDLRTEEFHVPELEGQPCLSYLSSRLRTVDGIRDIQADFSSKKVVVSFDGLKLAIKNIEIYIADAGFDVNERPGNETARASAEFPSSCR